MKTAYSILAAALFCITAFGQGWNATVTTSINVDSYEIIANFTD